MFLVEGEVSDERIETRLWRNTEEHRPTHPASENSMRKRELTTDLILREQGSGSRNGGTIAAEDGYTKRTHWR